MNAPGLGRLIRVFDASRHREWMGVVSEVHEGEFTVTAHNPNRGRAGHDNALLEVVLPVGSPWKALKAWPNGVEPIQLASVDTVLEPKQPPGALTDAPPAPPSIDTGVPPAPPVTPVLPDPPADPANEEAPQPSGGRKAGSRRKPQA